MDYLSVTQFAQKYGVSERTARNYCAAGKIQGTFLTGKTWNIPADAALPSPGAAVGRPMYIYDTAVFFVRRVSSVP